MWTNTVPPAPPAYSSMPISPRERHIKPRSHARQESIAETTSRSSSVSRSITSEDFDKDTNHLTRASKGSKSTLPRSSSTSTSATTLSSFHPRKLFRRSRTSGSTTTSSTASTVSSSSESDSSDSPQKERKRDRLRRKLAVVLSPDFYLNSISVTYPVADGFVPVFF